MTVLELKKYIYDNKKIEFILNEIGCSHIVYHPNKGYYSCANVDGDNIGAINIKNNKYLNCRNYTRNFDDNADLLTLVQYNKRLQQKNFAFWDTMKFLHKVLGLKFSYHQPIKPKEQKNDPLYIFKKVKYHRNRLNVLDFDFLPESELYDFIPHIHIDWFREGIIKKTVKKFGLAYSFKYKRNVIPLRYWLTGEL